VRHPDPGTQSGRKRSARKLLDEQDTSMQIETSHPPVHPGAILRDEFLEELGLTPYALAKACKMNRSKVERIVRGELGISGDTAARLGRFFGNSAQFWMNLQARFEVLKAEQEIGSKLAEIEPYRYEPA
jgi:antitoxin HigA-1